MDQALPKSGVPRWVKKLIYTVNACALGPLWAAALGWSGFATVLLPPERNANALVIALCMASGAIGILFRGLLVGPWPRVVGVAFLFPFLGAISFSFFYFAVLQSMGVAFPIPLGDFLTLGLMAPLFQAQYLFSAGLISALILWPLALWTER